MNSHKQKASGIGAILLILAGLMALNAAAAFGLIGWRVDFTKEGLYSFSTGTRAILKTLDEPVRLDFYVSRESIADIPELRAHAQRVEEYLEELIDLSAGSLEIRVINPQPFSESEDDARAAGLVVTPVNNSGATAILGVVAVGPTGRTKSIPIFAPERDSFIEYEVSKAIATVGRTSNRKLDCFLACHFNLRA